MAGMPKQGYTNLVLAGWVPHPALGCEALGGPWGGLVALGDTSLAFSGTEGDGSGGKKKQGRRKGKERLSQRRNLIRAELYSPAKDIGYFRDIGKK